MVQERWLGDGNVTTRSRLLMLADRCRGPATYIQELPLWQADHGRDGAMQALSNSG